MSDVNAMTDRMLPIFRATPIALLLYVLVSSVLTLIQTYTAIESIRFAADGSFAERVTTAQAMINSLDSLFFYTGLAALVAFALRFDERKT
ncbi:MAG: hypothetical protein ACFB11_13765 [Paracoccaceae bacterium]